MGNETSVDQKETQHITVQFPAALFEDVKEHARINHRSIDGEIICRVEQRYLNLGPAWGLRDEIAMRAVAGWLASFGPEDALRANEVAEVAYEVADAMLRVREDHP